MTDSTSRPLGHPRGILFGIVLFIVTFSLYGYYWTYKTHDELMPTRGIGEELRTLAAITLRVTLEPLGENGGGGEVPTGAALSLLTAAFGMKDEPKPRLFHPSSFIPHPSSVLSLPWRPG